MNHKDLHDLISDTLKQLKSGKIKRQDALAIFQGSKEISANCRNELRAIEMGVTVDVPLLGIKQIDSKAIRRQLSKAKV